MAGPCTRTPVAAHVDRLVATCRLRFVAGTYLMRYGEGDWTIASSPSTSAQAGLDGEQLDPGRSFSISSCVTPRCSAAGRRASRPADTRGGDRRKFQLATSSGTVPSPAMPSSLPRAASPSFSSTRATGTGLSYSLLADEPRLLAGLFTPEQAAHHSVLIPEHLLFSDGARLMDRPVSTRWRRDRFSPRRIPLVLRPRDRPHVCPFASPLLRGDRRSSAKSRGFLEWTAGGWFDRGGWTKYAEAFPRQRNAYFSSSDAAFPDCYAASAHWNRVAAGTIACEGGWRVI